MAAKKPLSPMFILFLSAMLLLIGVGVFLLIYGSMHNLPPTPSLPDEGLFAMVHPHA